MFHVLIVCLVNGAIYIECTGEAGWRVVVSAIYRVYW